MHYYKFSIGDYRRDTGHLSLLEHGIYRSLLDTYFLEEKPLCADKAKLMRSHSVRTAEEEKALDNVLSDFFELTENGYLHKRCEKEIDQYQQKSEKAKQSAQARWAENNKKSEPDANHMRSHSEGNANHKPLTNNHKPITNKKNNTEKNIGLDVFEFWKITMNHPGAKFDDKRRKLIEKALGLGYTIENLKSAITGCAKSEYHMGGNPDGTIYDDLGLIFRDAGKIDGFIKKSTQVPGNAANRQFNRPTAGLAHDDTSWADELFGNQPPISGGPDQQGFQVLEGDFSRLGGGNSRP